MRLFDYMQSSEKDRTKWLDSFQITTGLKYFGGKSVIGKYLMNHICNMAVQMSLDGKQANIFIDAFTGGGKLGLSVPEGWFDTIVMNDLNYGVYSYFKSCKENPKALIEMIEFIGSHMDKNMYYFIAFNRANNGTPAGSNLAEAQRLADLYDKADARDESGEEDGDVYIKTAEQELQKEFSEAGIELDIDAYLTLVDARAKILKSKARTAAENLEFITDTPMEELAAGAMTYWVTQMEFLGTSDPYTVAYTGETQDNKEGLAGNANEKEKIERAIKHAKRQIPKIARKLRKNNVIIENLDYRELIKKYNGLEYVDTYGVKHEADKSLGQQNKLWYFDPPYHPATLYAGQEAPYEDKFTWAMSREMVQILHNEQMETYGEIRYFIKSDYDPKYCYKQFSEGLEIISKKLYELYRVHGKKWTKGQKKEYEALTGNNLDSSLFKDESENEQRESKGEIHERINKMLTYGKRMTQQMAYCELALHDFDTLEDIKAGYYKILVGSFDKGVKDEHSGDSMKGQEFIWCRGFKDESWAYKDK